MMFGLLAYSISQLLYKEAHLRLFVGLMILGLVGCESGPSYEQVTGTVKLDGQPISGATVTFSPDAGGTGAAATGKTDENGVYTLTDTKATKTGAGAMAGTYKVGILWYKPSDPSNAKATGLTAGETTAIDDSAAGRTKVAGPEALLPSAYTDPQTSGLTATVAAGTNEINFELDSDYKGPAK